MPLDRRAVDRTAAEHVYAVAFDILPRNRQDNTLASLKMSRMLIEKIKALMGTRYWDGSSKAFVAVGKTRLICINTERELKSVSDKIDLIWGQKRR